MTPEQKARQQIDRQLEQAGWIPRDYGQMNITAGLGVAVREFPLTTGHADYMLYADAKVVGVVEAKPKGHTLTGVETQSGKYLDGLPVTLPSYRLPLPFAYESTGEVTQFTNTMDPDARSRAVFTFHRPDELIRLVKLDKQMRTRLRAMPPLNVGNLWQVQIESIHNLETSLAANRPRALIQMATGSGKTFTAVNFCYRLIKYADARRILFLVDRNNLGKQTLNEFQQFVSPVNGYKFTEEYTLQHLKKNTIAPASKVCVTTIQRLYSMLKGEDDFLEENEEGSLFETENSLFKEPLAVIYNQKIPIETFDFIVVDECHRSIYNIWRQVLEYFDSFLIGLTATPSRQTIGFFGGNLVQDYAHERAVVDGVNVGYDVYRIETKKTHFVIVDAVGVCEGEKTATKPLDRKPSVSLDKILSLVAAGAANDDVVSALASRLSRLGQEADPIQQAAIQKASGGKSLAELSAGLLVSIDPDANTLLATEKFNIPEGQEPTEEQVLQVEREQMATALKSFHDPKLRDAISTAKRSLEQVIDEQTPDQLLRAGFDAEALEKAKSMLTSFRKFIEDNKDEIEALQVLYGQPYRAGLKFRHVKELAAKLNQAPFFVDPNRPESLTRLWQAYEVVEPDKVRGKGGKQLVDVIALVRHAIDPNTPLAPVGMTVEERYQQWMAEKQAANVTFTDDQRKWLDAIKDHIASSLNIEQDDLEGVPFNAIGGLGRAYELFGDKLTAILDELNTRLAA